MYDLKEFNCEGWIIIEQRALDNNVVGTIKYAQVNADGSFGIGWMQRDGINRTTLFSDVCWQCSHESGIIFLIRMEEDSSISDRPWPTAHLYTLVRCH